MAFSFVGNGLDLNVLNSWLLASAAAAAAVIWWLFRGLYTRVEKSETALADFKLHCAEIYVTSNALEKALNNLNDTIKAVFSKLEKIDDKLAMKADRT